MIKIPMFQTMDIFPKVLKFLEENAPEAWFKPMFMSAEQRKEQGMDF